MLSPTLFLFYTCELPNCIIELGVTCKRYPDVVKVYKKNVDTTDEALLQPAIIGQLSMLTISTLKTCFLMIGFKKTVTVSNVHY